MPSTNQYSLGAPLGSGASLSRDGRRIALGLRTDRGEDLVVRDAGNFAEVARARLPAGASRSAWSPDGKLLAVGSGSKLTLFSLEERALRPLPGNHAIHAISLLTAMQKYVIIRYRPISCGSFGVGRPTQVLAFLVGYATTVPVDQRRWSQRPSPFYCSMHFSVRRSISWSQSQPTLQQGEKECRRRVEELLHSSSS